MRLPTLLTILCLASFLTACQSTSTADLDLNPHLLDMSFAGFEKTHIETEDEIFDLTPEAKAFVTKAIKGTDDTQLQIKRLVKAIFNHSDLNMIYDSSANTVAGTTFANGSANCLSLSIMTYALARHAGFGVTFREIDIPEYWTRREGYSLINGHINLRLYDYGHNSLYFEGRSTLVDFDPFSPKKYFPSFNVEKQRVIAMFYNNKGADALVNGRNYEAYAYFRAAILADKQFQDAWANMGILYRMTGHYDWAENTYEQALTIDDENLTIWENLAILHRFMGRFEKANEIKETVEFKRQNNPYYHFMLGELDFEAQNYELALGHFRKAIKLDGGQHQFYFGVAKVRAAMGDKKGALVWLKRAKRNTSLDDVKERYQNKMDLFASL